jgi:hypothetical protein
MKKASKPAPKTLAKKAPAIKQSAAKPKAKSSSKPNPRKAQGQAELLPILERLAQSAERLAQAAERLAQATLPKAQASEQHDETLKTPEPPGDETAEEEAADLAASQQREMVDAPDLIASEQANTTDSTALEEYPGIPNPPKDE